MLADQSMPVSTDGVSETEPRQFYEPWLFQTMLSQLAVDELGVGFIYSLLDLLAERHELTDVVAVLSHESFGTQVFRLGGKPVSAQEAHDFGTTPGVFCSPDKVPAVECEAVQTACLLTLALHNNRYNAGRDPLTGVENRGGFDKALAGAASDAARYGWAFTIVLLDLDDFHAVNRRFGLQYGDNVLRNLGFALRKSVRRGDTAARYGGDEFVVILKNAEGSEAKGFLDRLRENLAAAGHRIDFTHVKASSPQDSTDPLELVKITSERLSEKKRGKR